MVDLFKEIENIDWVTLGSLIVTMPVWLTLALTPMIIRDIKKTGVEI